MCMHLIDEISKNNRQQVFDEFGLYGVPECQFKDGVSVRYLVRNMGNEGMSLVLEWPG